MRNVLKKVGVGVFAMLLSCGIIVGVCSAASATGKYSKLVGSNDTGSGRAIATMTNTSTTSRYSQVFVYRAGDNLIDSKEKSIGPGASLQVITSNSYKIITAVSCIYNSAAPASGSSEGLEVTIK